MTAVLAAASSADVELLFLVLAFVALCAAVWCAVTGRIAGAAAAALVAVVILIVAV